MVAPVDFCCLITSKKGPLEAPSTSAQAVGQGATGHCSPLPPGRQERGGGQPRASQSPTPLSPIRQHYSALGSKITCRFLSQG